MILLVHLLFGAAIGSVVKNVPLAIVLAFLSHYFLDFLPHIDYHFTNMEKRGWIAMLPNISKVALDFCSGILLIFMFSNPALPAGRQAIIYVCAFLAILPDGFTVLNNLIPNKILKLHAKFHPERIHSKYNPPPQETLAKQRKISKFWRITSQAIVVVISILLLKF